MPFQDHIKLAPSTTRTSPRHSSPISELPVEIITQIFLSANPTYKLLQPPSPRIPPLQLCHVCRGWREIAFDVPQLWDGLYLSQRGVSKLDAIFRSAHAWLGRAKNKPSSFRFQCTAMTWNHDPAHWTTLLSDTCLHLHLDSLILQLTGDCSIPSMTVITSRFENAKALKRVCLSLDWQPDILFPVPWSQLTHLYIPKTLNYHGEWKDFLFACVNLEQGIFEIRSPPHQALSTPPSGCLPHLREIALETPLLENPNIYHGIELPSLKALCISSTREHPAWGLTSSGAETLKIQLRSIETLSLISTYSIPTSDIHCLLRDTPEVTELDLQLPPLDIAKILGNVILRSPSRPYSLPRLLVLKLELRHVRIYGFLHYLERFVRSRFEDSDTGVLLERVVLFCVEDQRSLLKDVLEAMKPFVEEGLKLEVRVRCTEEKFHWSNRLDSEMVDWPEGLAVAADCSDSNG